MSDEIRRRRALLVAQCRSQIERARAVVDVAKAACDEARPLRASASSRRRLSRKHTDELLNALDNASRDMEMLKARIDKAMNDMLRPRLRRR